MYSLFTLGGKVLHFKSNAHFSHSRKSSSTTASYLANKLSHQSVLDDKVLKITNYLALTSMSAFTVSKVGLLSYLVELPGEVVCEALLLLLVVERQRLLLLLERLDLLQQRVGDELLLLLGLSLLQEERDT